MIELNEQQQKEDFSDRLKRFKVDFQALQENYKLTIEASLFTSPRGIIPTLSITDTKYAPNQSQKPSSIITPASENGLPITKQKSVADIKNHLPRNSQKGEK